MRAVQHKDVIFHITRFKTKTAIGITEHEHNDLLQNLKPSEIKLYSYCKFSPNHNPTSAYFSDTTLSAALGVSERAVANIRSSLAKAGYLLIIKFKDEKKNPLVRVVVGKLNVRIYQSGLMATVEDTPYFDELEKRFGFMDEEKTIQERQQLLDEANQYHHLNLSK